MISIRAGVFETNSSSTHSLSLFSVEDFEKWKSNELVYDSRKKEMVPKINIKDYYYFQEKYPNPGEGEDLEKCINEFLEESAYEDYTRYKLYDYTDTCEKVVYDSYGNKEVAVSMYYKS